MNFIKSIVLLALAIAWPCFAASETLFSDIEKLAQKGDPEAQYHLGMFYNNGIGTSQDTKRAYEWFQKSAAGADPLGNYKLGCYYSGQGNGVIAVDQEKALLYKLVAAKEGYVLAQYDVAEIYFHKERMNESIHWLKQAADQGMFNALYALSNLYYQGEKVAQDPYSAYLYLNLAAKVADSEMPPQIKSTLNELTSKISSSDKAKADKMIAGWKPQPSKLTTKAFNGLQEAKDYASKHK